MQKHNLFLLIDFYTFCFWNSEPHKNKCYWINNKYKTHCSYQASTCCQITNYRHHFVIKDKSRELFAGIGICHRAGFFIKWRQSHR